MIGALYRLLGHLASVGRALRQWHYRHRLPPQAVIPGCDPLGDTPGEHNLYFVSRHDLAECGLRCPSCRAVPAERGDFAAVRRTQHGEAVQCSCGAWLAASPDTEHGDDLLPYDHQLFHTFVRISKAQALRERYGEDMAEGLATNRVRLGADLAARLAKEEARQIDPKRRDTQILPTITLPSPTKE
jgi:hypothetical protein